VFCFPFQQKSRCIKLVTDVGFRLMTIRDVVPMKSKPALFSLYCSSLRWDDVEVVPSFISIGFCYLLLTGRAGRTAVGW
jgi:hypothetical protein